MDNGAQTTKVKMSGYLQLKIKKRVMSSWKSYWFVLEDRLLLYYRSKAEYDAISPCKGSINLGPPCAVKSLSSVPNAFQIETRTTTYTLKAENPEEQKKWMQVLLSALHQNQNFTSEGAKRLSHFRYSLDDLIPEVEPNDSKVLRAPIQRQNTLPQRLKGESKNNNEIIQRLQKMGAHSYGGSLEAISKIATKKAVSPTLSDAAEKIDEEFVRTRRCGNNIYERISGDSLYSARGSFLVDNENYSVPLRRSAGVVEGEMEKTVNTNTRETKSLMVENDQYSTANRQTQSDEVIYAEPKINTDCNKNSVLLDNPFYASADVVNQRRQSENLYEDLDKFSHYSRPIFKPSEENSSQSSVEVSRSNANPEKLKKSKSFIRRVWKKKRSKKEKKEESSEEGLYAEVDPIAVEKVSVTDGNAIQMLSELHSILEHKKKEMKANVNTPTKNKESGSKPPVTTDSETVPSLPPKTHKISQETAQKPPLEQVRSLDEILEDLDKEKLEAKSKVQMLIEKFSEPEPDVILRRHDADFRTCRHSDDLNLLLDELAKVTSAPIMTPGVTSSLVNPNLTDEEWLKLLPVRQRRLSEPDYDIPRQHSSLQIPEKDDSENVDIIPATRFFGPVLPDNKDDSLLVSMTPDSLEVEQHIIDQSYTSHHYNNINKAKNQSFSQNFSQDDKIIYALPKTYMSVATHIVNTCQNIFGNQGIEDSTIVYKTVKNMEVQEEIFKDSLELCNETSTEF